MANENKTFFAKGVSAGNSISWKDIFSGVFQKHTRDDLDKSFSSGLRGNTPAESQMLSGWQKPWLFSRFLVYGLIAWIALALFANASFATSDIGALFLIPTSVVPIAALLFFWEMNIPRNIPIYTVLKLFIFSGLCSGFLWYLIQLVISNSKISQDSFLYWLIVGVVEELVKLIMVAIALRKVDYCWGLNGFVVGAAVGCGFAVFETIGYVFNFLVNGSLSTAFEVASARGVLAIDGHIAWAAMFGGALALAKGRQKLAAKHFGDSTFLITFIAAIVLHGLFDYYDYAVYDLFGADSGIFELLVTSGMLSYTLMAIIFAIPTYAIILWVMRKSIRQVVAYSGGAAQRGHINQAQPVNNAYHNAYNGGVQAAGAVNYPAPAAPAAPAGVLVLECVSGELAGQSYTITKGRTFTIGRGHQNNVQYSDNAKGVSRSHCSVTFDGASAIVVDLGSSHGTFFSNGMRFQSAMRNPLKSGDTFYLASPKNTFRIVIK